MTAPVLTAAVDLYRDPEIFDRERRAIFAKTWQFLGIEADLIRAGDYLAEVIAGYPVMVVRDEKGQLHGYHNVCRHRAGPLVGDAKGRCDHEIVCRFHAWRYGFDGKRKEATAFGPAPGFDKANYSLFGLRVETWRGFVFINLDLNARPLSELMRPLDERLGSQPRRSARMRDSHKVACNWKLFVENYLDGYHQEGLHPSLATAPGAQRHDVHMVGDVALYEVPGKSGALDRLWSWVWPNLGVSLYRGVLFIENMRPEGADRLVIDHVFVYEPEDPRVDAAILNSERITEEDAWVSERVQQNLDAGVFEEGVLSPTNEGAVAWFQQRVAQVLSGDAAEHRPG
jgi:choline monooxygenase